MLSRLPTELRFLERCATRTPSKRDRRARAGPDVTSRTGGQHPRHPPQTDCRGGKEEPARGRAKPRRKKRLPRRLRNGRGPSQQGYRKCMFEDNECRETRVNRTPTARQRHYTAPYPEL